MLLADNPAVALAAVVHALALPVFYGEGPGCLDIRACTPELRGSADGIEASPAAKALDERQSAWTRRLPLEAEGLWDWLVAQPEATLTALLACCAASTLTAVRKRHERTNAPHLAQADRLAKALGLDMAQ